MLLAKEKTVRKPTIEPEIRYNVFSYKASDLCCAVPEDRVVPRFVDDDWTYRGTAQDRAERFPGFAPKAAALGVRLLGFHLFQMARSTRPTPRERLGAARGAIEQPVEGEAKCPSCFAQRCSKHNFEFA
jgi:hypothetical protein